MEKSRDFKRPSPCYLSPSGHHCPPLFFTSPSQFLYLLLSFFPNSRFNSLFFLFLFSMVFRRVIFHSVTNKSSMKDISNIFGAILMRPNGESNVEEQFQNQANIVTFLIANCHAMFRQVNSQRRLSKSSSELIRMVSKDYSAVDDITKGLIRVVVEFVSEDPVSLVAGALESSDSILERGLFARPPYNLNEEITPTNSSPPITCSLKQTWDSGRFVPVQPGDQRRGASSQRRIPPHCETTVPSLRETRTHLPG